MPKPKLTKTAYALGFAPTLLSATQSGWHAYKLPGGTSAHSAPRAAFCVEGTFASTQVDDLPTEYGHIADGDVVVTRPGGTELRVYRMDPSGVSLLGSLTPDVHADVSLSGSILLATMRAEGGTTLTVYDVTTGLTETASVGGIVRACTDGTRVAYITDAGELVVMARTVEDGWSATVAADDVCGDGSLFELAAMHLAGGHVFASFRSKGVAHYAETASGWERRGLLTAPRSDWAFGSSLTGRGPLLGIGGDTRRYVYHIGDDELVAIKTIVQKAGVGLDLAFQAGAFMHRVNDSVIAYAVVERGAKKKPSVVAKRQLPPTTGSVEGKLEPFLDAIRRRQNCRYGLFGIEEFWNRDAATVEKVWTPQIEAVVADWSVKQRTGGGAELRAVHSAGLMPNWFGVLRGIDLSDSNTLTAEPLMALAEHGREPHLEVLNLTNVPVSTKLLKAFDKTGYLTSLTTLHIGGRKRSDALVRALVGMNLPSLKNLYISNYSKLSPVAQALLQSAPSMANVVVH